MAACKFFGHRDCPEMIKPRLREALVDLITNHDVDMFYVGHQGQFDAYVPGKKTEYDDYSDTMLPEGIESVHPHYAISWRNNWMLRESDYVVTYITHSWGGAYQYAEKARRQKKVVINL